MADSVYNVVGPTLVAMATKLCKKITYNSACVTDRPEMFAPTVFGDDRFNGTMQNVVGPTLVVMATTLGLGAEI